MSPRRAQAVRGRPGQDPGTALREHLVDTAEQLLARRQVSAVTTRDIARAAGVSDGVLYNYFTDKHELIVAALVRRYSGLMTRFDTGLPVPGTGTVEENLAAYAVASLELVAETLPVASGLLSEPDLLHRFIAAIHQEPFGPHRMRQPISDYITAEQRLGTAGRLRRRGRGRPRHGSSDHARFHRADVRNPTNGTHRTLPADRAHPAHRNAPALSDFGLRQHPDCEFRDSPGIESDEELRSGAQINQGLAGHRSPLTSAHGDHHFRS